MAGKVRISDRAASAAADAMAGLLNGGWLDIYEGKQPKACTDAVPSESRLLASVQLGFPAFRSASNGEAEANPMSADLDVAQTGRPQWFRLTMSDHKTAVQDGNVAAAKGEASMQIRSLLLSQHSEFLVEGFTLVMPRDAAER